MEHPAAGDPEWIAGFAIQGGFSRIAANWGQINGAVAPPKTGPGR
jgi:hypothetical protein